AAYAARPFWSRELLRQHGIGFDLDQEFRRDELRHLHHCACRTDLAEHLAVRPADLFTLPDVGHEDARAYDIVQRGPGALQRRRDVLEDLLRLRIGIADADDIALAVGRRGTGQINVVADADGARIAHDRLPRRARGNVVPCRVDLTH